MMSLLFSRRALSLAVVSLLTSSVAAEVFEKLGAVPNGWRYSHTPTDNYPIRLQIALQQHNVHGFEQAVIDMSTPGHPNYGKHFQNYDEMKSLLLPSDMAVESVRDWLGSAGVTDVEQDADWITFWTTVGVANSLLDADFQWYVSDERHVQRLRTLQYSVPKSVSEHINTIQPTTGFGQIRPNRETSRSKAPQISEDLLTSAVVAGDLSLCDQTITPHCLRNLYNVGNYTPGSESSSRIGFASFLEGYARNDDLALFEENLAPYAVGQGFGVVLYNGGVNDQNSPSDSGEANLDLQYIVGVSARLPVTEFITGGRGELDPDLSEPDPNSNSNEPYLEFLQNIIKMDQKKLPQVLSTSYGEDEQTIPFNYARTVCNMYAQLGSRGVSVIFASGDSGVGAACKSNKDGDTRFAPQFPASCPWVTAVGGTVGTNPEKAVFFSSGGFSDYFDRPAYQADAVTAYLEQLGSTYDGLFDPYGRAFPDVAAQGVNYAVYDKGKLVKLDGTSAAAPTFSAIIALLNNVRLEARKPPLGFLNPWLYSEGKYGLKDIVDGGSKGCDGNNRFGGSKNGSPVIPYASWNATPGWDPVTGLGTPNFARLRPLALSFSWEDSQDLLDSK